MNILIVGASRGIGKAIAAELVRNGHKVLITGRNKEVLFSTKEELGENALAFPMDLTDPGDAEALAAYVQEKFPVDGVVLSAAQFPKLETKKSVTLPEEEELTSILDANVTSNYRLIRLLLPHLKTRKDPRVVIIGSTSGIRQDKGGVYGISKWALASYAYNLRDELKDQGIGVSLINPGGTFTETRVKNGDDDRSLLESRDFGILVEALFRMSPQAVLERVDMRPLPGDTY